MPEIKFHIVSNRDENLIINSSELLDTFLSGIPIVKKDGSTISSNELTLSIKAAQSQIEKTLGIKITKQVIAEDRNYEIDDFKNWLYIRTSFPVSTPLYMAGVAGEQKQIEYPKHWLSTKKSSIKSQRYRQISLVPNGTGMSQIISTNYNFFPFNFTRYSSVPNYWQLRYITGFSPNDIDPLIIQAIGKIAAINILVSAGDLIIGPGLTGTNLSIDGLSQSIQSAKSSSTGAYGPRIIQYLSDLKDYIFPTLKGYYKGILMTSA